VPESKNCVCLECEKPQTNAALAKPDVFIFETAGVSMINACVVVASHTKTRDVHVKRRVFPLLRKF